MKKTLIYSVTVLCLLSCGKEPPSDIPLPPESSEFTGVPRIYISTDNGSFVTSRDVYVPASFSFKEGDRLVVSQQRGQVRGRGNSSWWNTEKKSFRIKFDEKVSLMGRHADRDWCLVANAFDKTMLRNDLTYHMGRMSDMLDYTPECDFVEVFFNGSYQGLYILVDHLETNSHRVDADYLIEIDNRASSADVQFHVDHISNPLVIKGADDIVSGGEVYNSIVDFLRAADASLYSAEVPYSMYFDMDALVEWYVINELCKNNDSIFHCSCFMHFSKGGKLVMGPIWDYDGAWGNSTYNDNDKPEGIWVGKAYWYQQLLTDPDFVAKVRERLAFWYGRQEELYSYLEARAEFIEPYVMSDNGKWNTLFSGDVWNAPVVRDSYMDYVADLEQWMKRRFNWITSYFGVNVNG